MRTIKKIIFLVIIFSLFNTSLLTTHANYNPDDYHWVRGGQKIELGNNLANLTLDSKFLFLSSKELVEFQKANGNISTGHEIGSIHPINLEESWLVIFEYHPIGFVSDLDFHQINADDLLKDYVTGTKQSNNQRGEERGVEILGWRDKPYYNPERHELTYSILFSDAFGKTQINYFVRLLSRHGYVSATLITDTARFDNDLKTMKEEILPFFEWNEDRKYDAYNRLIDGQPQLTLSQLITQSLGIRENFIEKSQPFYLEFIYENKLNIVLIIAIIIVLVAVIIRKR